MRKGYSNVNLFHRWEYEQDRVLRSCMPETPETQEQEPLTATLAEVVNMKQAEDVLGGDSGRQN